LPSKLAHSAKVFTDFFVLYARFARLALRYWDKVLLLVLIAQCLGLMWVLSALSMAKAVDDGLRAMDAGAFFLWCSVWFAVVFVLFIFYNLSTIMSAYIRMHVDLELKLQVFDRFQLQSLRFQQSRPIGENMFRINNDTAGAAQVAAAAIPDTITRLVTIATTATLLFTLNRTIALFVLGYFVFYSVFAHFVTNHSTRFQNQVRMAGQSAQSMLQENLSAYVVSKAMAREKHEIRRYFDRIANLARCSFRFGATTGFCMEGLRSFWDVFVYGVQWFFCGLLVFRGDLSIGEMLGMGQILAFVIGPLQILVQMLIWFRVAAVTLRRVLETTDVDPEISDKPAAAVLSAPRGELAFENVSFRYAPGSEDVIRNLSFHVPPGRKLAIVGTSGAGKTTVFNLATRYYDPTGGRVLVDGKDLRDIDLASFRRNLSIVLQDNFMYSATIRDNILFGKPDAQEADLSRAVELAGLEPMLASLPDGLDRVLKEGGDLSTGQLQRIGIARAVIRDPRFLFLDEATSSLDPLTEAEILNQLRRVEKGRTRLVIAHNIVSVRDADEILVMSRGKLVQQGTHEELVRQGGLYGEMWAAEQEKMQMRTSGGNGGPITEEGAA
jgi:ABC-type multidrug transport system fused ATPase/permease subunit